jgi:predicted LPLAT superfamily acyltransferase/uncharacterized protein (DUF2062 family)
MILRALVVIPVYDNPGTIAGVVSRALGSCKFPVLVVDDGSRIPVATLLPRDERVNVLRWEHNRGKGMALRCAIQWALERGFTHLITLDGDGQHFPEDIPLLAEAVKKNPWNLVIGERTLDASAPGISHFGKKFSDFWVRYEADVPVTDSQSGFRAYPLFFLQTMRFLTRRYDFEIEALVRLLWRGVNVTHVPIRVLYQPGAARVSHFRKFRDNARISLLNTLLVSLSLVRRHREPARAALAVALGVLVGCTPLYGLHTGIAVALGVALRLNVPLLWLGSQVSIPPVTPLLAVASLKLGALLLGRPVPAFDPHHVSVFARNSALIWGVGSLALGSALGALFGALTYAIARKQAKPANWSGQSRGGRFGNGFLIVVLRRLGLRAGYFCLRFVVPYFYLFAPTARRSLNEYWAIRAPRLSWIPRQLKVLGHLFTFAQVLMDKVYRNYLGERSAFEYVSDGWDCVRDAYSEGRGVLLVGAHAGNADLAATGFARHGMDARIHTLQHEAARHTIDHIAGEKKRDQIDVIYVSEKDPAIYRVHQLLRNGEVLGLMADRPLDHNFELVPFLGRLAPVATSPFRIALATEAASVFICGFKSGERGYSFFARRPAPPLRGASRELGTYHYAMEYARWLESFLARFPEQWFNLYPFFSRPPTLPNGERCEPRNVSFFEEISLVAPIPAQAPGPSANA